MNRSERLKVIEEDKMNRNFMLDDYCWVTGNFSEPTISLFMSFDVCSEGFCVLEKEFEDLGVGKFKEKDNIEIGIEEKQCDVCSEKGRCIYLEETYISTKKYLCEDCLSCFKQKCDNFTDSITHIDDSGFKIFNSDIKLDVISVVEDKMINSSNLIVISSNNCSVAFDDLTNIREILDMIENPDSYAGVSCYDYVDTTCGICEGKKRGNIDINGVVMCQECRERISSCINGYIKDNIEDIISLTI